MANGMKKLLNIVAKLQVNKNHRNNYAGYSYRNAEDILAGLKPLMVEYGVLITIADNIVQVGDRYYVKSTVSAYDTEDGSLIKENSAFAREAAQKKGNDEAQITGAASSYARKYALAGMFNLSPSDEGEAVVEPGAQRPQRQAPRRAPQNNRTSELEQALTGEGITDLDDFAAWVGQNQGWKSWRDMTPDALAWLDANLSNAVNNYKSVRGVA